jgi:hypothetical protein
MHNRLLALKRYAYLTISLVFGATATGLVFLTSTANAAGQVQNRSIEMSSSVPSATGVTYLISFKAATTTTIGGIAVDICNDTPIVGSTTCVYPTGFSWGSATPTIASGTVDYNSASPYSGGTASAVWGFPEAFVGGGGANYQTLFACDATAANCTGTTSTISVTSGQYIYFTVTGVTNPSTANTPFYARIVTFDTVADLISATTGYLPTADRTSTTRPATFTGEVDYGGVALSTANTVSITATVMEQLTFCDSGPNGGGTNPITSYCAGTLTTPSITIGNGGTPSVLSFTADYGGYIFTQATTNASHGIVVNMKKTGTQTCGGLSSDGSTCGIPASSGTSSGQPTPAVITAGTAGIGLCVQPGTGVTATSPYSGTCTGVPPAGSNNPPSTDQVGMNDTTYASLTNLESAYGSQLYSSASTLNSANNVLEFIATASATTPPGIYTASYTLVATGTF